MGEVPTPLPKPVVTKPILTKEDWRERQRNLSFAEKIAILEKMRERDALIAAAALRRKSPRQPLPDREPSA
jgi:hypothetical protein